EARGCASDCGKKWWFDALWWSREGFGRLVRCCVVAVFALRQAQGLEPVETASKAPTMKHLLAQHFF
ncbi:hypothetical protein, partial [Lentimonas sp. CC10]|uniref:hypothetical protein n=1 Tax=Lentimonas sp. CC10 TaxID=2676095 RepID=UPI001A7E5FDF